MKLLRQGALVFNPQPQQLALHVLPISLCPQIRSGRKCKVSSMLTGRSIGGTRGYSGTWRFANLTQRTWCGSTIVPVESVTAHRRWSQYESALHSDRLPCISYSFRQFHIIHMPQCVLSTQSLFVRLHIGSAMYTLRNLDDLKRYLTKSRMNFSRAVATVPKFRFCHLSFQPSSLPALHCCARSRSLAIPFRPFRYRLLLRD